MTRKDGPRMNKKKLIVFSASIVILLLILLITAGIVMANFFSDGVHVIGNYAHISDRQTCYLLDTSEPIAEGEAPPIIGKSTFSISGYLHSNNGDANSTFHGNMEVSEHPISFTNSYNNISGHIGSKFLTINNRAVTEFSDETVWYLVEILKSDTDICVIQVFDTEADKNYLFVCGESEEDAISNYNTYLEKRN